jgi:hypothetical protein
MVLPCPHSGGADVELEAESSTAGDGVWATSGVTAAVTSADAYGDPACAGGGPLARAQTEALERRAAEAAALGLDVDQREAAEARAELVWDAWQNR